MLLQQERELIVEYGKRLITSGLTKGTGGNISIYNREKELMAISPSGLDYFKTNPEDIVVLNLEGDVIEGNRKPSSELEMHSIFYKNRKDISAVVHAHSNFATTIACLNWEIPAVHYLVAFAGKNVRCAKYATYGTKELAINSFEGMKERNAVLLANHGLLAGADNIHQAFNIAEEIEFCAEIYYRTKGIGDPIILPEEEMELMLVKFKSYGQKK
ncbi:MAG: fuculose phosphate aldolase [Anaerosolibacter sp.]|jgi:L-fuculose-phosphate aldolase|uniref:L-fuculose-phosphate aldolase n=1 Tax=Anaerosolibacter sp. TaxID=1872527 RepID=UPI0026018C9C|nr:L-fuculose-phosphate aldolase [Anaerosolibacter sp.]MDF2548397.1 fuculose phosphate aldolase [Anaerosolibacter sp.]